MWLRKQKRQHKQVSAMHDFSPKMAKLYFWVESLLACSSKCMLTAHWNSKTHRALSPQRRLPGAWHLPWHLGAYILDERNTPKHNLLSVSFFVCGEKVRICSAHLPKRREKTQNVLSCPFFNYFFLVFTRELFPQSKNFCWRLHINTFSQTDNQWLRFSWPSLGNLADIALGCMACLPTKK